MRRTIFLSMGLCTVLASSVSAYAQSNEEIVKRINHYGTFDHWTVREIKESGIIGGRTKYLYEFFGNPTDTIRYENKKTKAFKGPSDYVWRTNNVYANVAGVEKCSITDYPEKRGDGYCCRIEVHTEEIKVAGMINMEVVCQGVMLVGSLPEPIKDTKDPMSKPHYGIPFTGRPKALQFDYKAKVGCEVVKGTGFGKMKKMGYPDYPECCIILQKRWEDADGNIHALRVGTGIERITKNVDQWQNGHRLEVHYGDITGEPFYKDYMKILHGTPQDLWAVNSKGKNVKIIEEGWAGPNESPDTMIIKFIASYGEAFYGGVGNTLWIDNVKVIM